jgi:hypothetical protein
MPENLKEEINQKVLFIVMQIQKFAAKKHISQKEAFIYLKQYCVIDFLDECYESEHTFSDEIIFEDLDNLAKKNGGQL